MSTHKTENSLSKGNEKMEKLGQNTSIEEETRDLSLEHGPSVTRRKLDQLLFEDGASNYHSRKSCP